MTQSQTRKGNVIGAVEDTGKNLAGFTKHIVNEAKEEIIQELKAQLKKPDRYTDRFLLWVAAKPASWLLWLILGLTHAIAFSVGGALALAR